MADESALGRLVGPHGAVVDQLEGLFDAVAHSGRPHLVLLDAPTGVGKTRVVQELYERLVARQPSDALYWLPGMEGGGEGGYDQQRKLVRPRLPLGDGSVPWIWLGAHCGRSADGRSRSVVRQEIGEQILALSVVQTAKGESRQALRRLALSGAKSGMSFIPGASALLEMSASIETIIEAITEGRTAMQAGHADADRLRAKERQATDETLLGQLRKLWRHEDGRRAPLVLVLDDAHDLNADEFGLIARILTEPLPGKSIAGRLADRVRHGSRIDDVPVLLVLTRWPTDVGTTEQSEIAAGVNALADLLEDDGACEPGTQRITRCGTADGLGPLDQLTTEQMLGDLLPGLPEQDRVRVVQALMSRSPGGLSPKRVAWLAQELAYRLEEGVRIDDAWCADLRPELDAEARREWSTLSPPARALVQTASFGREVQCGLSLSVAVAESVALTEGITLSHEAQGALLQDMAARGILVELDDQPGWYRFGLEHRDFALAKARSSRTHYDRLSAVAECLTARTLLTDHADLGSSQREQLSGLVMRLSDASTTDENLETRFPDVIAWARAASCASLSRYPEALKEAVVGVLPLLGEEAEQQADPGRLLARFMLDYQARDTEGLILGLAGTDRPTLLRPAVDLLGPKTSRSPVVVQGLLRLAKLHPNRAEACTLSRALAHSVDDVHAASAVVGLRSSADPDARAWARAVLTAVAPSSPGLAARLHSTAFAARERRAAWALLMQTMEFDLGSASLVLKHGGRAAQLRVVTRLSQILETLALGSALSPSELAYSQHLLDLALDTVLDGPERERLLASATAAAPHHKGAALSALRHGDNDQRRQVGPQLLTVAESDGPLLLELARRCTDEDQFGQVKQLLEQHWRTTADPAFLLRLAARTAPSDVAERARVEAMLLGSVDDVGVVRALVRLAQGGVRPELRAELRARTAHDPRWTTPTALVCRGTEDAFALVQLLEPEIDADSRAALAVHILSEDPVLRERSRQSFVSAVDANCDHPFNVLLSWQDAALAVDVLRTERRLRDFVYHLRGHNEPLLAHDVALLGVWEMLDRAREILLRQGVVDPLAAAALAASASTPPEQLHAHVLLLRHVSDHDFPLEIACALAEEGPVAPELQARLLSTLRAGAASGPRAARALAGLLPGDTSAFTMLAGHAPLSLPAALAAVEVAGGDQAVGQGVVSALESWSHQSVEAAAALHRLGLGNAPEHRSLMLSAVRVARSDADEADLTAVRAQAAVSPTCAAALFAAGEDQSSQLDRLARQVSEDRRPVCRAVCALVPTVRGLLADAPGPLRAALWAFGRVDGRALVLLAPSVGTVPSELQEVMRRHAATSVAATEAWSAGARQLDDRGTAMELLLARADELTSEGLLCAAWLVSEMGTHADVEALLSSCAGRTHSPLVEPLLRGGQAELTSLLRRAVKEEDVDAAVHVARLLRARKGEQVAAAVLQPRVANNIAALAAAACLSHRVLPLGAADRKRLQAAASDSPVCAGALLSLRPWALTFSERCMLAERWRNHDLTCLTYSVHHDWRDRDQREQLLELVQAHPGLATKVMALVPQQHLLRPAVVEALREAAEDDPRPAYELALLAICERPLRTPAIGLLADHALVELRAVAWLARLVEPAALPRVRRLVAHHAGSLDRLERLLVEVGVSECRREALLRGGPMPRARTTAGAELLPEPPFTAAVRRADALTGLPSHTSAALIDLLRLPATVDPDAARARARLQVTDDNLAAARTRLLAEAAEGPAVELPAQLLTLLAADASPLRCLASIGLAHSADTWDDQMDSLRTLMVLPVDADPVTLDALLAHVAERDTLDRLLPVGSPMRIALIDRLAGHTNRLGSTTNHEHCADVVASSRLLSLEAKNPKTIDLAFRRASSHAACLPEAAVLAAELAEPARSSTLLRRPVVAQLMLLADRGDDRALVALADTGVISRGSPARQKTAERLTKSDRPWEQALAIAFDGVHPADFEQLLARIAGDPGAVAELATRCPEWWADNITDALVPVLRQHVGNPLCAAQLALRTQETAEQVALLERLERWPWPDHATAEQVTNVLVYDDRTRATAARIAREPARRCRSCAVLLAAAGESDVTSARAALEAHLEADLGRTMHALVQSTGVVEQLAALFPPDDTRLEEVIGWLISTTVPTKPTAIALGALAAGPAPHHRDRARTRLRLADPELTSYTCLLALAELAETPMQQREVSEALLRRRRPRRKAALRLAELSGGRPELAERASVGLQAWLPADIECAAADLSLAAGTDRVTVAAELVSRSLPNLRSALALLRSDPGGAWAEAALDAVVDHLGACTEAQTDQVERMLLSLPTDAGTLVVEGLVARRAVLALAVARQAMPLAGGEAAEQVLVDELNGGALRVVAAMALRGSQAVAPKTLLAVLIDELDGSLRSGGPGEDVARALLLLQMGDDVAAVAAVTRTATSALVRALWRSGVDHSVFRTLTGSHPTALVVLAALAEHDVRAAILLAALAADGERHLADRARSTCVRWAPDDVNAALAVSGLANDSWQRRQVLHLLQPHLATHGPAQDAWARHAAELNEQLPEDLGQALRRRAPVDESAALALLSHLGPQEARQIADPWLSRGSVRLLLAAARADVLSEDDLTRLAPCIWQDLDIAVRLARLVPAPLRENLRELAAASAGEVAGAALVALAVCAPGSTERPRIWADALLWTQSDVRTAVAVASLPCDTTECAHIREVLLGHGVASPEVVVALARVAHDTVDRREVQRLIGMVALPERGRCFSAIVVAFPPSISTRLVQSSLQSTLARHCLLQARQDGWAAGAALVLTRPGEQQHEEAWQFAARYARGDVEVALAMAEAAHDPARLAQANSALGWHRQDERVVARWRIQGQPVSSADTPAAQTDPERLAQVLARWLPQNGRYADVMAVRVAIDDPARGRARERIFAAVREADLPVGLLNALFHPDDWLMLAYHNWLVRQTNLPGGDEYDVALIRRLDMAQRKSIGRFRGGQSNVPGAYDLVRSRLAVSRLCALSAARSSSPGRPQYDVVEALESLMQLGDVAAAAALGRLAKLLDLPLLESALDVLLSASKDPAHGQIDTTRDLVSGLLALGAASGQDGRLALALAAAEGVDSNDATVLHRRVIVSAGLAREEAVDDLAMAARRNPEAACLLRRLPDEDGVRDVADRLLRRHSFSDGDAGRLYLEDGVERGDLAARVEWLLEQMEDQRGHPTVRPLLRFAPLLPQPLRARLVEALAASSELLPVEEVALLAAQLDEPKLLLQLTDRSCIAAGMALVHGIDGADTNASLRLLRKGAKTRDDAMAWLALTLHDGKERRGLLLKLRTLGHPDALLRLGAVVLSVPAVGDRVALGNLAGLRDRIRDFLYFLAAGNEADLPDYVAFCDAAGLPVTPRDRERATSLLDRIRVLQDLQLTGASGTATAESSASLPA